MLPFVARDIVDHLTPDDQNYFRSSREQRLGMSLEAFTAGREDRLPALRESLAPLRTVLADQPFLAGAAAMYADYAVFGQFQWARCISPFQLLEAADPIAAWRERMLDLFGGLARSSPGYDLLETS